MNHPLSLLNLLTGFKNCPTLIARPIYKNSFENFHSNTKIYVSNIHSCPQFRSINFFTNHHLILLFFAYGILLSYICWFPLADKTQLFSLGTSWYNITLRYLLLEVRTSCCNCIINVAMSDKGAMSIPK